MIAGDALTIIPCAAVAPPWVLPIGASLTVSFGGSAVGVGSGHTTCCVVSDRSGVARICKAKVMRVNMGSRAGVGTRCPDRTVFIVGEALTITPNATTGPLPVFTLGSTGTIELRGVSILVYCTGTAVRVTEPFIHWGRFIVTVCVLFELMVEGSGKGGRPAN